MRIVAEKENMNSNIQKASIATRSKDAKKRYKSKDHEMNMIENCLNMLKNDEIKKLQIISKMRNF